MSVFFFINYAIKGPSSRYRFYNLFDFYDKKNLRYGYSYFWGNYYTDKVIPEKNKYTRAYMLCFYFAYSFWKRIFAIIRALDYDIIHIERDFIPGFSMSVAIIFKKVFNKKLIFEMDDAVYLTAKPKGKIENFMKMCDAVIVGNDSLKGYAEKFCSNVIVNPTSIKIFSDFESVNKNSEIPVVGWIGTYYTLKYLDIIREPLEQLAREYKFQLRLICNRELEWSNSRIDIVNVPWSLSGYKEEIRKFDIGVMPLVDSEWEHGKCGFKLIQYMGECIPVVASPIGVNNDLVKNNENGFVANSSEEWYQALDKLLNSEELREQMGKKGLEKVIENYNVDINANRNYSLFIELVSKKSKCN